MKKISLAIALLVGLNVSMAQTKSSGVVTLNSLMTLKIDMNATTSVVTVTLTGPTDRWFGIGFNSPTMSIGTDCIYYLTSLVDAKITGQSTPTTDTTNEWTVASNTTSGTTRTLVLTRNFVGGTGDYTFAFIDASLNIIWAYGSSLNLTQHSIVGRGSTTLVYTLGNEDFNSLNKISINPNPTSGLITLTKNNQISITKLKVYDPNGKLVHIQDSDLNPEAIQIDLSKYSSGVYFIEISNNSDKIVRKILKE